MRFVFFALLLAGCGSGHDSKSDRDGAAQARGPKHFQEVVAACGGCGASAGSSGCPFASALTTETTHTLTESAALTDHVTIAGRHGQPLLVQLSLAGCAPCTEQKKALEGLMSGSERVAFAELELTSDSDFAAVAETYGVRPTSFPQLLVVEDGQVREELTPHGGKLASDELSALIAAAAR